FFLRAGHPRDRVEQQRIVVARGEPLELVYRAVQQHRAQRAYFTVDVRGGFGCLAHPLSLGFSTPLRRAKAASILLGSATRSRAHSAAAVFDAHLPVSA